MLFMVQQDGHGAQFRHAVDLDELDVREFFMARSIRTSGIGDAP